MYVKKCTKVRRREIRKDLEVLDSMLEKTSLKNTDEQITSLLHKLYKIVLHLKLSHTNTYSDDLSAHLMEYLDLAIRRVEGKTELIDMETAVVLFYNCLKVIVGLN